MKGTVIRITLSKPWAMRSQLMRLATQNKTTLNNVLAVKMLSR